MKTKTQTQTLGMKLKRYRDEHDLTLAQVAEKTGLKVLTIWRIEKDRVKPFGRTIYKLEQALPGFKALQE
jgi:transcriptional regulator with XRE-family HTH domain